MSSPPSSIDPTATKDVEHAVTPDEKASPSAAPTPTQPGRAGWLCVLGSACCLFMGFGFLNAFGVLQQYYETTYLRGTSPSSISWIGSISTFLLFGGNLVAGVLMDRFGPRPLMSWLVVSYTVACMLTSLCKEYYQVLLAQGVLFGLAASCSFAVPLSCIMLHFKEKRGPAMSVSDEKHQSTPFANPCTRVNAAGSSLRPRQSAASPGPLSFAPCSTMPASAGHGGL